MEAELQPDPKAILNERVKLTAGYLDRMAGAFFTAGVVAPAAAAVFGLAGPSTSLSTLTLGLGALIFLLISTGLYLVARRLLKGLKK